MNMNFASDNVGPAHPRVMQALLAANEGTQSSYGADDLNTQAVAAVREVFEAPEAAVYFVATGTAANALALATLAQPWDAIFCHRHAHIEEDEANAPEFYTGGAKLTLVDGDDGKMTPAGLAQAISGKGDGVHQAQRGPVSITQATEVGTCYTTAEISNLCDVARNHGCQVHLDGARFANAVVLLGCSAAEMTWKAGVDAVSFGGTKNGLLGCEAVVFFDPAKAWEFELRRKRGAHLFSKHRYLSTQMLAALTDGLWLEMATSANTRAAQLAQGISGLGQLCHPLGSNLMFVDLPMAVHHRLQSAGVQYFTWDTESSETIRARLVCDWSKTEADVDAFVQIAQGG